MSAVALKVIARGVSAALLAASLGAAPSLAQESGSQPPQAAPPGSPPAQRDRDLDARLAAARERLAQAAREVAELSAQLGTDARNRILITREGFGRGVIGVQLDPASGPDGARVLDVSPGGPAAEAGVRAGDVVVAVDGASITGGDSARKLVERMRRVRSDEKLKLSIKRDGKLKEVEVTTRPAYAVAFAPFGGAGPVVGAPALPALPALPDLPRLQEWGYLGALSDETWGMELAKLTPALGWYFGTDKGVLVLRASDDDAFKLKDGDVILSIDGREPQSGAHATRILRSYQPGERITLKIMRRRQPMSLAVTLPQPQSHRPARGYRAGPGPGPGEPPAPGEPAEPGEPL